MRVFGELFAFALTLAANAERYNETAAQRCAQIVVFKDSSSGSTWWAERMNQIEGVELQSEIVNKKREDTWGAGRVTKEIIAGLEPACDASHFLTGFTVNPKRVDIVRWEEVRKARPDAIAVVYDRTNWVKKVMSYVLFRQEGCHNHNVRTFEAMKKCRSVSADVSPPLFLQRLRGEACDSARLFEAARTMDGCRDSDTWRLSSKYQRNCSYVAEDPETRCALKDAADRCVATCTPCDANEVVVTTYEAFREDTMKESKRFLEALGLDTTTAPLVKEPAPADASPAAQRPWTPRRRPVRTLRPASIKRSSEDVREGLTNWREVARGLRRWSTPACDLEAMMRDTVGTTPFRCDPAVMCEHLKAREAREGLTIDPGVL
mmetsp:Transcript_16177/g.50146  ORF Transcript_16177/g.50146 Transcript_16177/m.50146 type:complete len:377 (-) Transcript_16177:31-1161(-)